MNQRIQHKIEQFKKMATTHKPNDIAVTRRKKQISDGLSKAIHTKKDADVFMAELQIAVKQAE